MSSNLGSALIDVNLAIVEKPYTKDPKPYTVEGLAEVTNFDIPAVEEALAILEKYSQIKRERGSITLHPKADMSLLPKDICLLIDRAAYPEPPTEEEKIIVYLLLNNATEDNPISIPDSEALTEVYRKGDIKKVEGGCYLTRDGGLVAGGLLEMIPEMKSITMADLETPNITS